MHNRIKYTCKNCGWQASVVAEWADVRPRRCGDTHCKTSFLANPDSLQVDFPKAPEPVKTEAVAAKSKILKKNKEEQNA